MPKRFEHIYQFKITLKEIKPTVWRRIQVPEIYTFWDLHVAIQDAMGWFDSHLHEFSFKTPVGRGKLISIGIPFEDYTDEVKKGWKVKLTEFFTIVPEAEYMYDFGDGWTHSVKLEKVLPAEAGKQYPVCIAGKRACPPEDVGGISGYYHLLEVLADPTDPEYEEFTQWLEEEFDPEYFNCKEVVFDDPKERREFAGLA